MDGAASQEAGQLGPELRQAPYAARLRGGPAALTAPEALALGTIGGVRCLDRADGIGSLEARISGLETAGALLLARQHLEGVALPGAR